MNGSLDNDQMVRAFKALAHPNRLSIYLTLLATEEADLPRCSLSTLMDRLDIGAPTVSHHTRELVNAGLIQVKREGKFLHCRLDGDMRARLARFFSGK
jgi:DNA-binding transcriptional ArsR family regulator